MLDDLRNAALQEDEEENIEDLTESDLGASPPKKAHFLGMSAQQRFIIAVLLVLLTAVMGMFFLALAGKIAL